MKVRIKRSNVATVHIGIGHDDELMIAELSQCSGLWDLQVYQRLHQCSVHVPDLFVFIDLMLHCFFHVQDLTPQRKNSLETTVAALLGSTTGRSPSTRYNSQRSGSLSEQSASLPGKPPPLRRFYAAPFRVLCVQQPWPVRQE